jgi:hypothetical protein
MQDWAFMHMEAEFCLAINDNKYLLKDVEY